MEIAKLKIILEAILLASDRTLSVIQLADLFELDEERPTRDEIRQALHEMADDYAPRGYELKQVASGFRLQVKQQYATWVARLWEEKPARYTRALLETMALIAYRQPITRGEIEEVRGVSVSSNIVKTLLERDWIKVLGHKDVPGKPTLYGTTRTFLDYFNLTSLDQLPTLAEIKDLDKLHPELALDDDATANITEPADQEKTDQETTNLENPELKNAELENVEQENVEQNNPTQEYAAEDAAQEGPVHENSDQESNRSNKNVADTAIEPSHVKSA